MCKIILGHSTFATRYLFSLVLKSITKITIIVNVSIEDIYKILEKLVLVILMSLFSVELC